MDNSVGIKINEIETTIISIFRERFSIGAECISQLSAIDLFYLYGEISTRFNVFLTLEDIEGDCFSSLHNLVLAIHRACNQGGKNSEETC